jgi:hypothetical protein
VLGPANGTSDQQAAHAERHMTITIELHWEKSASDPNVIEQTDLEKWAVGAESGYHYFASGAIMAPPDDVDKVFK